MLTVEFSAGVGGGALKSWMLVRERQRGREGKLSVFGGSTMSQAGYTSVAFEENDEKWLNDFDS